MYAIIQDSGQQFKVTEGERIDVDLRDVSPGDEIVFDRVLFCSGTDGPKVGTPCIPGAHVRATVEDVVKGEKVISFKFRRRKNYHRKKGHRQKYLRVRITEIHVPA